MTSAAQSEQTHRANFPSARASASFSAAEVDALDSLLAAVKRGADTRVIARARALVTVATKTQAMRTKLAQCVEKRRLYLAKGGSVRPPKKTPWERFDTTKGISTRQHAAVAFLTRVGTCTAYEFAVSTMPVDEDSREVPLTPVLARKALDALVRFGVATATDRSYRLVPR